MANAPRMGQKYQYIPRLTYMILFLCCQAFSLSLSSLAVKLRSKRLSLMSGEVIDLLSSSDDDDGITSRRAEKAPQHAAKRVTASINVPSEVAASRKKQRQNGLSCEAPIKLFATAQDLRERSSTTDPNHWSRTQCLTLREMLGYDGNLNGDASIEWFVLSNFLVDFDFLLEEVPELLSIPRSVVFYGEADSPPAPWSAASQGRVDFRQLRPSDPPGSPTNPLRQTMSYGVHHTKAFLVGLSNGTMRVVVHTSNLRREDVQMKAQAAFIQDFPLKSDHSPSTSDFESDLVSYFESYGFSKRVVWGETVPSETLSQCLRKYDYSSAMAILIPSIPGYHSIQGRSMGHLKLRHAIASYSRSTSRSASPITCQFSSIGSLNEKYLLELQSSMDAPRTSQSSPHQSRPWDKKSATKPVAKLSSPPRASLMLRLVYPTMQEICASVEGPGGGSTVPGRMKNLDQKAFLRPLLHRWSPRDTTTRSCNPIWKSRNVPHLKTYYQLGADGNSMQWLVVSSHNLSMAAWGTTIRPQFCRPESRLMIRSWELGVLITPSLLKRSRLVPWSPSLDDDGQDGVATVPLPYPLIPDPYGPNDVPWAVDRPFEAYR